MTTKVKNIYFNVYNQINDVKSFYETLRNKNEYNCKHGKRLLSTKE